MELNTWGIVGICYIAFWLFMSLISMVIFKKDKNSWLIPVVVALVMIPTYIFGLIGND